jgi:hypothetical protein
MHIEAELDDIHSERLALLQQRLQKPLPEVLATVIDWAINYQPTTGNVSAASSESDSEVERLAALAHLDTISIDWGGKPIENRDALYDDARG